MIKNKDYKTNYQNNNITSQRLPIYANPFTKQRTSLYRRGMPKTIIHLVYSHKRK